MDETTIKEANKQVKDARKQEIDTVRRNDDTIGASIGVVGTLRDELQRWSCEDSSTR
jgi:chorismate synthase